MRRWLLLPLLLAHLPTVLAERFVPDPTAPMDMATYRKLGSEQQGGWILNSTLVSPQRRVAIINGKALTLGDWVGDAQIISIEASQVQLATARKHITLRLIAAPLRSATGQP